MPGSAAKGAARPGTLRRSELEALGAVWAGLGDSRAVLVTGGQEGKAGAALGLAAAAAAAGRRTVLVECDFERPVLAQSLGLSLTPGLGEYLRLQAGAPQILQSAVLAGPASGQAEAPLVCVVAGDPGSEGAALLGSEGLRHAVAKLRGAYELLVIDGPAGNDGGQGLRSLAAQADATLACLGPGESSRRFGVAVTGIVQRS